MQDFQSFLAYVGPCLGKQVNLLNPRLRVLRFDRASGALSDSSYQQESDSKDSYSYIHDYIYKYLLFQLQFVRSLFGLLYLLDYDVVQ